MHMKIKWPFRSILNYIIASSLASSPPPPPSYQNRRALRFCAATFDYASSKRIRYANIHLEMVTSFQTRPFRNRLLERYEHKEWLLNIVKYRENNLFLSESKSTAQVDSRAVRYSKSLRFFPNLQWQLKRRYSALHMCQYWTLDFTLVLILSLTLNPSLSFYFLTEKLTISSQ